MRNGTTHKTGGQRKTTNRTKCGTSTEFYFKETSHLYMFVIAHDKLQAIITRHQHVGVCGIDFHPNRRTLCQSTRLVQCLRNGRFISFCSKLQKFPFVLSLMCISIMHSSMNHQLPAFLYYIPNECLPSGVQKYKEVACF